MRLGYPLCLCLIYLPHNSFNEAEAHAPRIRVCAPHAGPARISFNEAEAHAPRIPAHWGGLDRQNDPASMRPRRMRLGYIPPAILIPIG